MNSKKRNPTRKPPPGKKNKMSENFEDKNTDEKAIWHYFPKRKKNILKIPVL